MSGPAGPGGLAGPIVQLLVLMAGIMLVVFGPDTSLGLGALGLGLVLVVGSLVWWLRTESRRR